MKIIFPGRWDAGGGGCDFVSTGGGGGPILGGGFIRSPIKLLANANPGLFCDIELTVALVNIFINSGDCLMTSLNAGVELDRALFVKLTTAALNPIRRRSDNSGDNLPPLYFSCNSEKISS